MFKQYTSFISAALLASMLQAQSVDELTHLASYETGGTDAAEVVSYDAENKQVYFTSSAENKLTYLNVSDPSTPTKTVEIDLSTYGGGPNSVDNYNGVIAVAVENDTKTDAGFVVFFDKDGTHLKTVTAGSLPDMLTFTPDGSKIIVANEGEPNDDYSIDPEGSVSIIDLSNGVANATVTTIGFTEYNDKKVSLQNKGIRIFGNNGAASVAQDMEPEYITVSADGLKAYVSCQENNALALIDLENLELVDILPLGYKDHSKGTPTTELYKINELAANWPSLGTPTYNGGQPEVMLGGFSGLYYADKESTSDVSVFYAVPDRGPNDAPVAKADVTPATSQNLRPFKLPDYQGRIVKFTLNHTSGAVTLDDQILLTRQDGTTPITGKGNIEGTDEVPVTYTDAATDYTNEDFTDVNGVKYHALPYDPYGGDFEGILKDKNGDFWMCDEYRPAIYHFEANGTLKHRYIPADEQVLVTKVAADYGEKTLPAVYNKRWANRGFEGIGYDSVNHVIYAFIQSPMYNPSSVTKNNSDVIRILAIDATDGTPVAEYVYLLERNKDAGYSASRTDKIGDACFIGDGKFLVIERDSEGPDNEEGKKYIYEVNLTGATNILNLPISAGTLEINTADELADMGIQAVHKTKVVNLPSVGYKGSDKAEGVALLPDNKIAVINDNDFGLAGAGITDNSVLGIISFDDNYGFDASNKDDAVNITNHPTLGMLLPDAITSYEVNGKMYIVTANEGDSRDYDGYSEEVRVKDLKLDLTAYPDAAALQEDEDLGRLKTTTSMGDYDNDGDVDQIYSYGARSFSIFDQYGNLVFDSGDDFAQITNTEEPDFFNVDEDEKDGRSDDKGVEPEAVTVAEINGSVYAFVGFERSSAIVVYDVTDPFAPEFVTYYSNRNLAQEGDIAPEIIKFVSADKSTNGKAMLVVGYEVSGTVGFIQVGTDQLNAISETVKAAEFSVYPNPVSNYVRINKEVSGTVYNTQGVPVMNFKNTTEINVSELPKGMYIISTENEGSKRFLKL